MRSQRHACATLVATATTLVAAAGGLAGQPQLRIIKPSNTGIQGEWVRFAKFDPGGSLWVSARWPFWSEGGVGILDFQDQTWKTFANWDSPVPSQYVNDIEFGSGGVVWMATDGGLVKKDGDRWTIYNTSNAPLLHNVIRNIELDSDGHVWINNTQNTLGAIFEFDGNVWTSFSVPTELPWQDPWRGLSGLLVDSNDHVWVANGVLNGVAEYDGQTWTLHGAGVNRFGSLREDLAGNIWLIAGVGGGNAFYKFDGATFTTYTPANTPFANTTITTSAVDELGNVYVGNWMGQVIKTGDAGASWSLFTTQNASIFSIVPHPTSNDVWVTTPGAARHLDPFGVWIEAFNTYNTGMPDYFIDDLALGSNGLIWMASAEAGVSRFDGLRWFNMGSHNPNRPWPVLADGAESVFLDSQGNVWIGSNGVARWDGQSLTLWDWRNSSLGVETIVAFAEDASGTIWAGTDMSGVIWLDGSDWSRHLFAPPGWTANWVEDMDADLAGNVWVATFIAVHMFDGQTWNDFPALNAALFNLGGPNAIKAGQGGIIWIGTDGELVAFDGTNWTVYDTANSPLPAAEVQDIALRSDGLMAVSTMEFGAVTPFPNGVAVIDGDINDPANWTVHTYANSPIPHYQLGKIAFDANGDLWISAISEGVAVLELSVPSVPGDLDGDGDVDLDDHAGFYACMTGPDRGPVGPACDAADFDGDGDCDLIDLDSFQLAFTGAL